MVRDLPLKFHPAALRVTTGIDGRHAAELCFQFVCSCIADVMFVAQVRSRNAGLVLLKDRDDLLLDRAATPYVLALELGQSEINTGLGRRGNVLLINLHSVKQSSDVRAIPASVIECRPGAHDDGIVLRRLAIFPCRRLAPSTLSLQWVFPPGSCPPLTWQRC